VAHRLLPPPSHAPSVSTTLGFRCSAASLPHCASTAGPDQIACKHASSDPADNIWIRRIQRASSPECTCASISSPVGFCQSRRLGMSLAQPRSEHICAATHATRSASHQRFARSMYSLAFIGRVRCVLSSVVARLAGDSVLTLASRHRPETPYIRCHGCHNKSNHAHAYGPLCRP
jgi:hypothetical protein